VDYDEDKEKIDKSSPQTEHLQISDNQETSENFTHPRTYTHISRNPHGLTPKNFTTDTSPKETDFIESSSNVQITQSSVMQPQSQFQLQPQSQPMQSQSMQSQSMQSQSMQSQLIQPQTVQSHLDTVHCIPSAVTNSQELILPSNTTKQIQFSPINKPNSTSLTVTNNQQLSVTTVKSSTPIITHSRVIAPISTPVIISTPIITSTESNKNIVKIKQPVPLQPSNEEKSSRGTFELVKSWSNALFLVSIKIVFEFAILHHID
jgi:hypothetical protein